MCGIVGMVSLGNMTIEDKLKSMLFLFTEILQITQERGKDATGVSSLFNNGDFMVLKDSTPSPNFISRYDKDVVCYNKFIELCKKNTAQLKILLGHCRKSSVGNHDNVNNHPIKAGNIIGIHNGTLTNHEIIFDKLECERDGTVDSEAIMRLLDKLTDNGKEPFTVELMEDAYRRLEGAFSVLSFNINNPNQVAFLRKVRPMEMALIRPLKILMVASEKKFFDVVLFNYNKYAKLYDSNFKCLTKDDISFKAIPLDSAGVINLPVEVTGKTTVDDCIEYKDAYKATKIWQTTRKYNKYTGTGSTNSNWKNRHNIRNYTDDTYYLPTRSTTTTTNSNTKKEECKGKIFCKSLNSYVNPGTVEKYAKKGAVVVDSTNGDIIDMEEYSKGTEHGSEKDVVLINKEKVELSRKEKPVPIKEKNSSTKAKNVNKTVEVDLVTNPDVIKAAEEYAMTRDLWEDDNELTDSLEAGSVQSIRVVPAFALANRVAAHICRDAFIAGAKYAEDRYGTKGEKAARIAKKVAILLSRTVFELGAKNQAIYGRVLREELHKFKSPEINKENIKYIFSKGNLTQEEPINELHNSLKE